jgi:translation initiation factor IF-3
MELLGIYAIKDALKISSERGEDLVEMLLKLSRLFVKCDFGKFKYESKKEKDSKKAPAGFNPQGNTIAPKH